MEIILWIKTRITEQTLGRNLPVWLKKCKVATVSWVEGVLEWERYRE
jgi:hypothetical protein